ncbi:MAG: glucokinase, partial [Pseudomonadales bacterium]|nr:glucokinase [Pseudomonadales bacterium]
MSAELLVGDIGGTNARFALVRAGGTCFEHDITLRCDDYGSPEAAIRHYLQMVSAEMPEVVCVAVAGPVVSGAVEFTNSHWRVDERHLAATLGLRSARLINDFAAVALSIPMLETEHLMMLGGQHKIHDPSDRWCIGVLGPGTGLGAAGLFNDGDKLHPLVTEAGHAGFAPATPLQAEILKVMNARFYRV